MPTRGCRDLPPGDEPLGKWVVLAASVAPVPPSELAGGQEGQGGCVSSSPACGAARQAEARHCPPPPRPPQCQGSKGKAGVPKLCASARMVSRGGPVGGPSGWRAPQPPPKADFGRNPMGPGRPDGQGGLSASQVQEQTRAWGGAGWVRDSHSSS